MNIAEKWIQDNRAKFMSTDGLPGLFCREYMFGKIGPRKMVGIVDRFGKVRQGRVVMRGPAGWVLNMGGNHGTPAIATADNTVYVAGVRLTKGVLA